jgi:predicted O-methyltransferase YrrM
MTRHERLLLYKHSLTLPENATIVEVGSYLGASACFLAAGLFEKFDNSHLHCVDTWENDAMSEGVRDTWAEFSRNTIRYKGIVQTHRGDSRSIAEHFQLPIDLLFLDGDHSYSGCKADVESWLPKVKANGILLMHDIAWAEGVKRVVGAFGTQVYNGRCKAPNLFIARKRD